MKIKVGFGFDVHQLKENLPLTIGGIEIPHSKGSLGHSDGDTLIHAICDALLGAANMRDIGFHFPDTDPTLKGIDSKKILKQTIELITEKGFAIGNIDSTICLQKPKIKDYIPEMQKVLAKTCNIAIEDLSIKATTTEKLGFEGREEGISAYATVLIEKQNG
ncbi:MAG: 2-C-methyl-D-erythritol 2,4-cyclodiphosphate synthase [Salinivirgaceae bacterium]|nr:2-C-methyl-D-erythritol 2,4-cyclodiphosphate synthase [Salinivirgaceae bacterium]